MSDAATLFDRAGGREPRTGLTKEAHRRSALDPCLAPIPAWNWWAPGGPCMPEVTA